MVKKIITYRNDKYIIKISPLQERFLVQLAKNFESKIYTQKTFNSLKEAKKYITDYFKGFLILVEV